MSRYADNVYNVVAGQQVPLSGVSIYVYDHSGNLATLTADGGGSLDNPVTSDIYGGFYFNAPDGLYSLEYHYGGREVWRQNLVQVGVGPVLPDEILAALSQTSGATLIGSDDGASGSHWTTVAGFISYLLSSSGAGLIGGTILPVASRTALKAVDHSVQTVAYLTEAGREGPFIWKPLVSVARHAADTDEFDLVAPSSGSVGAWERATPYGSQDVRAIARAVHGGQSGKFIVEKIANASATEYSVMEQFAPNSPYFWRWHFTNHCNGTNDVGDSKLHNLSLATLFVKTAVAHPTKNNATADQQANVTAHKDYTDGTETGTFASSTFDTIVYRHSSTAGDKVVFTITGVERIGIRTYSTSNSGPIKITIKTGGVEIASNLYTLPAGNVVNPLTLSGSVANSGGHITPIAAIGLTEASTYEVTVEVDSSIAGGNQIYVAGLFGWAASKQDATGLIGLFTGTSNLGGRDVITAFYEGNAWIQQLDNTTRITWRGVAFNESGFVRFTVKKSDGTTIFTDTLDLYSASTAPVDHVVISGLAKGTYYLIAECDGTKNASSARYRVDHSSVEGADETATDDYNTGTFELNGAARLASSVDGTAGTESLFFGGDNELAFTIWKTTETVSDAVFVGGVHGHESNPDTMTFTLDGVAIDFAGGADGDRWVANDTVVIAQTGHDYRFGSDADFTSPAITGNYLRTFDGFGYRWEWNPTIARDLMSNGSYVDMNESRIDVNGAAQPRGTWTLANAGATLILPRTPEAFSFYNDTYAYVSWPIDLADVLAVFDNLGFNDSETNPPCFLWDTNLGWAKFYIRGWTGGDKTVPSGTTWTQKGQIVPLMVRGFGAMI